MQGLSQVQPVNAGITMMSVKSVVGDGTSSRLPPGSPVYLTHTDVILRYTWVGLCLGFRYSVDAVRLKRALQDLLLVYEGLAGR